MLEIAYQNPSEILLKIPLKSFLLFLLSISLSLSLLSYPTVLRSNNLFRKCLLEKIPAKMFDIEKLKKKKNLS